MEGRTFSHYRVLQHLGGGGMGVVYKAEDVRLKRTVALKFLPRELTRDPEARERFIQEAQAASALDHPNICTIYDVDTADDGQLFIAMAYYDGETLKQRLRREPPAVLEALDIASQIARGLDKAHHAGIIHRDIKPANLMIAADGLVKIVDFGIAKLTDHTGPTRTGTTLGTVGYMAPEQVNGEAADHRVDVWALGVVLYEMLAGAPPFAGANDAVIINRILQHQPASLKQVRSDVPFEAERVVERALAKRPEHRYASAADFLHDLTACHTGLTAPREVAAPTIRRVRRNAAIAAVLTVIGLLAIPGGWWLKRMADQRRFEALIADAVALDAKDQRFAAFAALEEAERLAANDSRVTALRDRITITRTIHSDPAGAQVLGRDYSDSNGEWRLFGETPLVDQRFAQAVMRWKLIKDGYEPSEFILPTTNIPANGLNLTLVRSGSVPPDMVLIQRPRLALTLTGFDYTRGTQGDDFLIDKYEVTNKQFKAFVDAGGYTNRAYWKEPIIRDGHTIPWEQAATSFADRTGRPGPSTWEVGTYAAGHDNDPVGGISWYEAAAYAEYAGKALPTVYHWLSAATVGAAAYITPMSNLDGKGPAAVGASNAISGNGVYDMAGNVKEWCWNAIAPGGGRYILGGSWVDPPHSFVYADARPPLDRAETNGFRLVKYLADKPLAVMFTTAIPFPTRDFSKEKPVSDQVFQAYRTLYSYDQRPLDARIEESDGSAPQWVKEKVTFTAAYGQERVPAYVFLPKNARPPYQTVVFAPGAGAVQVRSSASLAMGGFDFLLLSGRAVVFPVYQGMFERGVGRTSVWPEPTRAYQDWIVQIALDARRTLDYIETRSDLRGDAVTYYGASFGAIVGSLVLGVEPRFRVGVLTDGGFTASSAKPPAVDQFNFAPRITVPILMINGDSDYIYQVESQQKPLFDSLGTPVDRKRHRVLHSGHFVIGSQRSQVVREILDWLDRYVGRVGS